MEAVLGGMIGAVIILLLVAWYTYCLGLSAADAEWFLGEMRARDVTVMVNGSLFRIAPGDSVEELVAEVGKRQNAAQVAASMAKAKKAK